jgi:hypothetical protein
MGYGNAFSIAMTARLSAVFADGAGGALDPSAGVPAGFTATGTGRPEMPGTAIPGESVRAGRFGEADGLPTAAVPHVFAS